MNRLINPYRSTVQPHSRKNHLLMTALLLLAFVLPASSAHQATGFASTHADLDLASYVNPFIGTNFSPTAPSNIDPNARGGNVFPGAAFPHGMMQWSPDTTGLAGGYRYYQSVIHGFSLTHFSGRACISYQDVPFMPTVKPITTSPVHISAYASSFSHSQETASPGYYGVHLDNGNIDVALTVTPHSGFGRFTYPGSSAATMLINVSHSASGNTDAGTGVQIVGNNQVVGSTSSGHFCGKANTYTLYFAATFDHPFTSFGTWHGDSMAPNSRSSNGLRSGAYVTFDTSQNAAVQVKVGISFVSVANAQANVESESPTWGFEAVHQGARAAWNSYLNAIQVTGGTSEEQQT